MLGLRREDEAVEGRQGVRGGLRCCCGLLRLKRANLAGPLLLPHHEERAVAEGEVREAEVGDVGCVLVHDAVERHRDGEQLQVQLAEECAPVTVACLQWHVGLGLYERRSILHGGVYVTATYYAHYGVMALFGGNMVPTFEVSV